MTRAADRAAGEVALIEELGGEALLAPTIRIVEPSDGGAALSAARSSLVSATARRRPDWLLFTSANAVAAFLGDGDLTGALEGIAVAAVGVRTAQALEAAGVGVDLVPERFVAESLLAAFPEPPTGGLVWFPRAEVAREVLPEGLARMGWQVEVIPAYRTVAARPGEALRSEVRRADAVVFASASAVTGFVDAYGTATPPVVAAIGPVTAERARQLGIEVQVQPEEHTLDATIRALAEHLTR